MAIWQYACYLIPTSALAADGSLPIVTRDGHTFEMPRVDWPVSGQRIEQLAAEILPPAPSWNPEMRLFGGEARHDISVWYEGEHVRDVRVRIDLRNVTREVVRQVVHFAGEAGCFLLDEETLDVVPATETTLARAFDRSTASRFVRDPQGFIERLSRAREAPPGSA